MTITYFAVDPAVAAYQLPPLDNVYPAVAPAGIPIPIAAPDLALHAILDVTPFPGPVTAAKTDWIGMLMHNVTNGRNPLGVAAFGAYPSGWKGDLSEKLAFAVSLSVATKSEGFKYFLPMQFAKTADFHERPSWPYWACDAAPTGWRMERLFTAHPKILMPDYVLMDFDHGGNARFSVLEAKGRDRPVHTASYYGYSGLKGFKHQSQNARISVNPATGTAPALHRKILSLVTVRPDAVKLATRELRCRWFNQRTADDNVALVIPPRWAIAFATSHYAAMFRRMGLVRLSEVLRWALAHPRSRRRYGFTNDDLAEFLNGEPERVAPRFGLSLHEEEFLIFEEPAAVGWRATPFITKATFKLLVKLVRTLRIETDSYEHALALLAQHANSEARLATPRDVIMPSGIGLTSDFGYGRLYVG